MPTMKRPRRPTKKKKKVTKRPRVQKRSTEIQETPSPVIETTERREPSFLELLGVQIGIALSAVGILMLIGVVHGGSFATRATYAASLADVTLSLEHQAPLTMDVRIARKEHVATIDLENTTSDTMHISLPSDWTRLEVRGAPLAAFRKGISVFGFTRYEVPPFGGMSFSSTRVPGSLYLDDPAQSTALVRLTTVDLRSRETAATSVLVDREAKVSLWGK